MYPPRALPRSLGAALRDASHAKPEVRASAAAELGRFKLGDEGQAVLDQLVHSLTSDSDHRVRAAAAVALADLRATSAEVPLLEASREEHPRVRQMALLALGELGSVGPEVLARFRVVCRDELAGLRFQALIALVSAISVAAERELLDALGDEDAEVRYIAVRLTEEHFGRGERSPELSSALGRLLVDPDATVRLAAALIGARDGVPEAAELIVATLNAQDGIRQADDEEAAIAFVGDAGLAGAIPGLRRRLGGWLVKKPFDWLARVALCQLGDPEALERLLLDLGSKSASVRSGALAAVARGTLSQARPLIEAMRPCDDEERASCERALKAIEEA